MSSTPASWLGWLPTIPTACPSRREKPQTMFLRVVLVHLEELAVVHDQAHHVAHVIGLVRVVGYHVVELGVHAQRVVAGLYAWRGLHVVLRQEAHQVAAVLQARVLVF